MNDKELKLLKKISRLEADQISLQKALDRVCDAAEEVLVDQELWDVVPDVSVPVELLTELKDIVWEVGRHEQRS